MEELEIALAEEADLAWAGGFHYASFLADARPLGLLLEEETYRVLVAEISLAGGAKTGEVMLALPAEGRGRRPAKPAVDPGRAEPAFADLLAAQVIDTHALLDAVIARPSLSLSRVMALQEGDLLPLPGASLDQICLDALGGKRIASGKLGQNRGMRAIKLADARATSDMTSSRIGAAEEPGPAAATPDWGGGIPDEEALDPFRAAG